MTDTASISALISAAAVVGALTTSSIVTWYVEVSQLLGDIGARSKADTKNDTKTREFTARLKPLQTRRHALLWVAIIQWVVVGSLLFTALWLAQPTCDPVCRYDRFPFFLAALALIVALVVLPVALTITASRRLKSATAQLT